MSEQATKQADARNTPDAVIARQRGRQMMVLSGVVIALSALAALTYFLSSEPEQVLQMPLLGGTEQEPAFISADVQSIEIWKGRDGEKLRIVRDGDSWRVPTRYDVAADNGEVNALLTKIADSRILSRPVVTNESRYVFYQLADEDAANLRLIGKEGAELLHLLVGRPETGNRAFVRFKAPEPREGIFEVTGASDRFDSLFSRLNLSSEGAPDSVRWLDLSSFRPLPFSAVTDRVTIRDGERELTFARVPGSDEGEDLWEMTSPRRAAANNTNIRGIIDALMNYSAQDIAGRVHPDGPELGVADATREIRLEYRDEGDQVARLFFGKSEDGRVAVLLKRADAGELVYWCPAHVLSRLFRPTGDYLERARLQFTPDGIQPHRLSFTDFGATTTLERDANGQWMVVEPFPGAATRVDAVLAELLNVRGYEDNAETVDRVALGLGQGISESSIEAAYTPRDSEPSESRTTQVFFGAVANGEIPALRMAEGEADRVYWIPEARVRELFRSIEPVQSVSSIGALERNDTPTRITVRNGDTALVLTRDLMVWKLDGDDPEDADQQQVESLRRLLEGLQGVPFDAEEQNLGFDESAQVIEVALDESDTPPTVSLRFGASRQGFRALQSQRPGAEAKIHWVRERDVEALFADPADYAELEPFEAKVRQILISWHRKSDAVEPKEARRTRAQAQALVARIVQEARAGADFTELQKQHNEDSVPDNVYDVREPGSQFVKSFTRKASQLEVGEIGYAESQFGFHILKRIE